MLLSACVLGMNMVQQLLTTIRHSVWYDSWANQSAWALINDILLSATAGHEDLFDIQFP